jgi:drug/metabolite transporter (DMT)-like permease
MAASVITVFLFGWMCLGESCGLIPIIVAIVALCGIGVMTRPPILTGAESFDNDTLIGVSLALVCLLLSTAGIVTLRYLKDVHHGVLNTILYCWGFVQSLVLAVGTGVFEFPESEKDAFVMASVGVFLTGGYTFLVKWPSRLRKRGL